MGRKKEYESRQTSLFSEEELNSKKENTDDKLSKQEKGKKNGKNKKADEGSEKTKRSRSMIPFFLRSTREKKKAQEKYINDHFSDEAYKSLYRSKMDASEKGLEGLSDNVPSEQNAHVNSLSEEEKKRKRTNKTEETENKEKSEETQVIKKRGRPRSNPNELRIKSEIVGAKKSERLKKTQKRLVREYTDRYSKDIPDDIGMNMREKREFRKEIENINEKIQLVESDTAEIEIIPTELKNTYTVFRDAAVKHRLLTADEEKELSKRVQDGDEEAFRIFVEANYRLVIACAKQIYSSRSKNSILDYMDIIQEGIIGLLIAVSKFDWRHNTRFSTYGVPWIYQRINRVADSQRNGLTIPGYAGYCVRRMNEDIKKYQDGTLDETGMKQSEIKRMKELSMISTPMIAIDPSSDPDDGQGTISPEILTADSIKDDSAIIGKIEEEHYQDRFHRVLKDILKDDEYDILCQRHGMGEYEGDGTASLRTLAETRSKSIEYTRLQIESIEKKIRRSRRLKNLNEEWFTAPPEE